VRTKFKMCKITFPQGGFGLRSLVLRVVSLALGSEQAVFVTVGTEGGIPRTRRHSAGVESVAYYWKAQETLGEEAGQRSQGPGMETGPHCTIPTRGPEVDRWESSFC
jgi:hypothetical protein